MFFPTVEMTNKAVDVAHHFKYEGRWLDAFLVKVRLDSSLSLICRLGSAVDGRSGYSAAHSSH